MENMAIIFSNSKLECANMVHCNTTTAISKESKKRDTAMPYMCVLQILCLEIETLSNWTDDET